MDKVVSIKRKAQRYVQSGDLQKAVIEYDRLLETGELEPYDYLYLGDLLSRLRRIDDAVLRYRDAISSYERVGLYKNAIAVAKKLLRIRAESFDILKTLGHLYAQEGLHTDAIFYYMQYISAAPPETDADSIREIGVNLLGMNLPSPEVALKIVDAMHACGCAASGARSLFDLGLEYETRGLKDWGVTLKTRARQIVANVEELEPTARLSRPPGHVESPGAALSTFAPPAEEAGWSPPLKTGFAAEEAAAPKPEAGEVASAPSADPGASFGMIDLSGVVDLDFGDGIPVAESAAPESETGDEAAPEAEPVTGFEAEVEAVAAGVIDLSDLVETEAEPFASEFAPGDPDELRRQAEESEAAGDLMSALASWLAAARSAFNFGESRKAEQIYIEMVSRDPNHLEALQGLCEIAHINGERTKIVRFGCELGDVLLARELYAEAKLEFERVLQFDPQNEKARSRVNRLNSIDGVEKVTARPLAPLASEVSGATVSVRGEPSRTQSIHDLSEILTEFQKAMSGQLSDDDPQGRYDMGMTYMEMGMYDQAIEAFRATSAHEAFREKSLELLAHCYLESDRPETAVEVVDEALAAGILERSREAALYACRGLALEVIGYTADALVELQRALELDPDHLPAAQAVKRLSASAEGDAA